MHPANKSKAVHGISQKCGDQPTRGLGANRWPTSSPSTNLILTFRVSGYHDCSVRMCYTTRLLCVYINLNHLVKLKLKLGLIFKLKKTVQVQVLALV
jgi:hypothetical protein